MIHTVFYPSHPLLDSMVQEFLGSAHSNSKTNTKYPLTDVYEENGMAYMEIAVAGFQKHEIKILIDNDTLIVKGESLKEEFPNRTYIKRDIARRNFEKSYSLMFPIDKIDASFEDGILKITLIPLIQKRDIREIEIK